MDEGICAGKVEIPLKQIVSAAAYIKVTCPGLKRWQYLRVPPGSRLVRLGAWIIGCRAEIVFKE